MREMHLSERRPTHPSGEAQYTRDALCTYPESAESSPPQHVIRSNNMISALTQRTWEFVLEIVGGEAKCLLSNTILPELCHVVPRATKDRKVCHQDL